MPNATEAPKQLCEAFMVVAELCKALGESPVTRHMPCWECVIDQQWKIAVNGQKTPQVSSLSTVPIDPIHCYVEYNGWPAGIMNPYGGMIAAGDGANETTFIAAVRARIAQASA